MLAVAASRRPVALCSVPKPSAGADSADVKTREPVSSTLIGKTTPGASTKKSPRCCAGSGPSTHDDQESDGDKDAGEPTPYVTAPQVGIRRPPAGQQRPTLVLVHGVEVENRRGRSFRL